MANEINTDNLQEGRRLVFERSRRELNAPPQWDIRIRTRDGNDEGIAATINQDEVLKIIGGDKKYTIEIPPGMGNDPGDIIPKLDIQTIKVVPIISGGDFVLVNGKASVLAKPDDMVGEPTLTDDKASIKYADSTGRDYRTRTITAEPGAEISVVTPKDKTLVFSLSGSKTLEEMKKSLRGNRKKAKPAAEPQAEKKPEAQGGLSETEHNKISMAPGELPEDVRTLATNAAKSLTRYTGVVNYGSDQGDKIAPATERLGHQAVRTLSV